jgi:hypothetical protein
MTESTNAFQHNDMFWDYIKDNPMLVGISVSDKKGLDLLSALRDVRETYKKNPEAGDTMLTLLGTLLAGAANGEADEMVEEVLVQEAMIDIDKEIKGVLDEGQ